MWGQSKPVVLERYGRRRSRWSLPPWLVLMLLGTALGAAGVLYVQERHLPPRLSAGDSAQLRSSFEQADAERQKLKADLGDVAQRLDTALADKKRLDGELAAARATTERQREDIEFAVAALPPDPRGGTVEVRAGRFAHKGATLAYEVALTRERGSRPMNAVLQLVIVGDSAAGTETRVASKPLPVALGSHEILRGSQPLPEGFRPRQATINVLDRAEGRSLGMRVMYVK